MSKHPRNDSTLRRSPTLRSTSWWLDILKKRAQRMDEEYLDLSEPFDLDETQRRAAIKFFNAAFRAEESGLRQAHELAEEVAAWDPDLAEVLRLYGNEEGWHRELLTEFLGYLEGAVQPMGRVTRTFYKLYARAKRMETIVLTNLMFETIGATTYRMALSNVSHPAARQMLTILTRDESFHVPLNVHFLRHVLERDPQAKKRLRPIFLLLFVSLTLLPLASRPKAKAFDKIPTYRLARGYAEQLASLFVNEPDLELSPPAAWLLLFGLDKSDLQRLQGPAVTSIEAAEAAASRERVAVTAL